jgi:hypothetical protein
VHICIGIGIFRLSELWRSNLAKTLYVYDAAADALMAAADELEQDAQALATAIIGTRGDMDGTLSADQQVQGMGMTKLHAPV